MAGDIHGGAGCCDDQGELPTVRREHLRGQNEERADGWRRLLIDRPSLVRSAQVGQQEFVNSGNTFQVNTFLWHYGDSAPLDSNESTQSLGVGEAFLPCAGIYWIRPIRLDIEMDIIIRPLPTGSTYSPTVDAQGMGNLHSHIGIKLNPAANWGSDATLPDPTTYYLVGPYRPRKCLIIYVPRTVYVGTWDGGANPNWINAGDTVVDQSNNNALVGITNYFFAASLGQFNVWRVPPVSVVGGGLDTIGAGDSVIFCGDTRWVGPTFILNLNTTSPVYLTVEEYT
jgi:hypothetical protein